MDSGYAKICLSNFLGARIIESYSDDLDIEEKGIFIPLERNGLKLTNKNNVNAFFYICKSLYPVRTGWTHYFQLAIDKSEFRKWEELGYKRPYIGNLKGIKNSNNFTASPLGGGRVKVIK